MREIKFRFWRGELGMLYIDLLDKREYRDWQIEKLFTNDYPIMQYTGLKDKSGREIYEGDRTKRGDTIRIIEFDNGGFFARLDKGSSGELSVPLFLWVHNTEIIGNIYENN